MELVVGIFDKLAANPFAEFRVMDLQDYDPGTIPNHFAIFLTYSDLASNLGCLEFMCEHYKRDKTSVKQSPIIMSSSDFDEKKLTKAGKNQLLLIRKGEQMPGLTLKVKMVVASLQGEFQSLDFRDFQNSPVAKSDYWLYLSPMDKPATDLVIRSFTNGSCAENLCMSEPLKFFFVDACAVFGGLPSIEDPNPRMSSFAFLPFTTNEDCLELFEKTHKTLSLVYRSFGGQVPKGFLSREMPVWESFYKAKINPQYPISKGYAKFLEGNSKKGTGFNRNKK